MWNNLKTEIIRAIWIFAIVAVASILFNWIRTPVLSALADSNTISRASLKDHRGVFLNDNWSHKGRPEQIEDDNTGDEQTGGTENAGNDEPTQREMVEYLIIDLEQTKLLWDEGECIFVDARSPEEYEAGHIPGAINWPLDAFDEYHEKYRDIISPDDCIVVYCEDESCDFSADLADSLVWEYFQKVYRFKNGIDEWLSAINPLVEGPDPGEKPEQAE